MAFKRFKRFRPRRTRKIARYSRRYYRRRGARSSYGRKYRGTRRFPRSKEAKMIEGVSASGWTFTTDVENEDITFYPMNTTIIPSDMSSMNIAQGTNGHQRIGNKVRPIKLRLSGVLSYDRKFSLAEPIIPESFHIRLIVYQVRGANAAYVPNADGYHPLGIVTTNGLADAAQVQRLLNFYNDPYPQGNHTVFTHEAMLKNMAASKTPLRLGIGGQFRMLYTRTFILSSSDKTSYPFRIVTKCPNRFVWPENSSGQVSQVAQNCRNAVYICWLCVPQTKNPIGNIWLNYQTQLFYIDS